MKSKKRAPNSREQLEAVQLVRAGEKTVPQIAQELGVSQQQLHEWVRKAEQEELERLRRDNAQLKEDIEILTAAKAFFEKHRG